MTNHQKCLTVDRKEDIREFHKTMPNIKSIYVSVSNKSARTVKTNRSDGDDVKPT
jgi:hypothetical protein